MKKGSAQDVTLLLSRVNEGDSRPPGKLRELVYEDLRLLAGAYMQDELSDHTRESVAKFHECY